MYVIRAVKYRIPGHALPTRVRVQFKNILCTNQVLGFNGHTNCAAYFPQSIPGSVERDPGYGFTFVYVVWS